MRGPRNGYSVARRMGIRDGLLLAQGGTLPMNPGMARKVHFAKLKTARPSGAGPRPCRPTLEPTLTRPAGAV